MQWILVVIIIIIACLYAGWRAREAISQRHDPCAGCLGCPLNDAKRRNLPCEFKKQHKKFGRKEKKH